MKHSKRIYFVVAAGLLLIGAGVRLLIRDETSLSSVESPTPIPEGYELRSAQEKQDILWGRIRESIHPSPLPRLHEFGFRQLVALSLQTITVKGSRASDFAPAGWTKYLHARGAVAKVRLVPRPSPYTGVFQGADYALLRLSLTFQPRPNRPVAPGLALKILRDGVPSGNISALVSLDGQEQDHNFFRHSMSNIVPIINELKYILVHQIFKKASSYPEELLINDLGATDANGNRVLSPMSPRQIFFIPAEGLSFTSDPHDVREDFLKRIHEGTTLYHVYAAPESSRSFNYQKYTTDHKIAFLRESVPIADIITTSEFLASSFGDDELFFRHELRR